MRQADTLRRVLEDERADIHTAIPARVRSYDRSAQTADVEIACRRVARAADPDIDPDTAETYPILVGVPVCWPGGGGRVLSFDLFEGDPVLVVFCESSIGAYLDRGSVSDPESPARHGLEGAVVIPGGPRPVGDRWSGLQSGAYLGAPGGVGVAVDDTHVDAGGTSPLALAQRVETHLQTIALALDAIAGAAGTTSSYNYALAIATNPIRTTTLRGA